MDHDMVISYQDLLNYVRIYVCVCVCLYYNTVIINNNNNKRHRFFVERLYCILRCVCVCVCVCMCVCVCVCVYVQDQGSVTPQVLKRIMSGVPIKLRSKVPGKMLYEDFIGMI